MLALSAPCFFFCGHHLSLGIAIIFSLLSTKFLHMTLVDFLHLLFQHISLLPVQLTFSHSVRGGDETPNIRLYITVLMNTRTHARTHEGKRTVYEYEGKRTVYEHEGMFISPPYSTGSTLPPLTTKKTYVAASPIWSRGWYVYFVYTTDRRTLAPLPTAGRCLIPLPVRENKGNKKGKTARGKTGAKNGISPYISPPGR